MKPKAIIFDFDGTIVSSEEMHYKAFSKALASVGIDISYEEFARDFFGIPDVVALPELFRKKNVRLTEDLAEKVLREKKAAFLNLDVKALKVYPGMAEFIKTISDYYPIALCTGSHRQDIDLVLPTLDNGKIYPLMKHIVTADDVKHTKPDPESYLLIADYLGIDPSDCMVFEDTPTGIKSAKGAGMYVVALTHTNPREKLKAADEIIDTIIGYENKLIA